MEKYSNYKHFVGIAAKQDLPFGSAHVVQKSVAAPSEVCGTVQKHHLELSLNSSVDNAAGCFPDYWSDNKFEPFGDIFFIPANETIRIRADQKRQTSIVCTYEPDIIAEWCENKLEWTELRLQSILNIKNRRIHGLLFQLSQEVQNLSSSNKNVIELYASQVAIELLRHIRTTDEQRLAGGLSPWRLQMIDLRIDDFESQPTLDELAELCHISVRQLTRAFRISRDQPLGSYIAKRRADHAKLLIASGESIKSVAYTMGYSAPSNFTATFTRMTGESPRDFRSRISFQTTHQDANSTYYH